MGAPLDFEIVQQAGSVYVLRRAALGAAFALDPQLLVLLAIFGGVGLPDVGTYATTVSRDLTLAP